MAYPFPPLPIPRGYYQQPAAISPAYYQTPAPVMPPPAPTAPAAQPAPPDERIWVQGEVAAASWPVTANGFVRLWDSTAPVFYEKRADAQGKPLPLNVFDYKRRGGEPSVPASAQDYEGRLSGIEERLSALEDSRTAEKKKEETQ